MKLSKRLRRSFYSQPWLVRAATDRFHRLYYNRNDRTWRNTRWLGTDVEKCPLDLWIYQEILHELRPEVIIETGTRHGGSARYLASLCDLIGTGRVLSIDIDEAAGRPEHDRIHYFTGSSTGPEASKFIRDFVGDASPVVVILDSDHARTHVLDEMELYSDFVTRGSYLIVEDTNVNGHPVDPGFGPGPWEAIETFMARDKRFEIDHEREKFFLTFNPRGYLKKVA